MALALGNSPCKYSDCIHYISDCADYEYRDMEYCGKCKYMWYHIKVSKKKEMKQVDRFKEI